MSDSQTRTISEKEKLDRSFSFIKKTKRAIGFRKLLLRLLKISAVSNDEWEKVTSILDFYFLNFRKKIILSIF